MFADGPQTLAARKFSNLGFHSTPDNTALGIVYELEWKGNPLTDFEYFWDQTLQSMDTAGFSPKKT